MTTTIENQITERLKNGESVEAIAEALSLDVVDDQYGEPMVALGGWVADDGNAEVEYPHAESGREAADEYVSDGSWGEITKTDWIDVYAWRAGYKRDEDGDVVEAQTERNSYTVTLEPEEPTCEHDDGHDWRSPYSVLGGLKENPGCWGHGGGVIIKEVCAHCGAYKVTDTWAQNRSNGQQGLTSLAYEDADDDSLAWVTKRKLSKISLALDAAGYEARLDDDCLRMHVSAAPDADSGEDPDADAQLEAIRAIVAPLGAEADYTGSGNTDADGESDWDVRVELSS